MNRIRTLIVDDSALVRRIVTESLSHDPGIEVVGTAIDAYAARDKILSLSPDVITLDIEMPRMDGLTFLKLIMKHRPMPVIIMSSLTSSGSEKALEAMQHGAVDVIAKPSGSYSAADGSLLASKIKAAALARVRRPSAESTPTHATPPPSAAPPSLTPVPSPEMRPPAERPPEAPRWASSYPAGILPARTKRLPAHGRVYPPRALILMGASTGGTEALSQVLTQLPGDLPGICIVQHIPAYFSRAFAQRLNHQCELEVREAVNGDRVHPGLALVAPGGHHLVLRWATTHYLVELNAGPLVHHQRPAVDVLFDSAAKAGAAPQALALLLTGMGSDGAAGLLTLREAGARTVAQSEESCVVFGMPREAIRMGAAQQVLHLERMPLRIEQFGHEAASAGRNPVPAHSSV